MRTCKSCGSEKPLDQFASAGTVNGVEYRRWLCIPCYTKSKSARKEKLRDRYYDLKKTLKCVECGNDDFRVLEFDHLDETTKEFSVAEGMKLGYAFSRIEDEIKKCQVLCANCHRIKTYERGLGLNFRM